MSVETRCRACNAVDLIPVLRLGQMPLANSLLTCEEPGQA